MGVKSLRPRLRTRALATHSPGDVCAAALSRVITSHCASYNSIYLILGPLLFLALLSYALPRILVHVLTVRYAKHALAQGRHARTPLLCAVQHRTDTYGATR